MTIRGVVRHTRYWRGVYHKWSTVYHFSGTPSKPIDVAAATLLLTGDRGFNFVPATYGGTYECDMYNQATGGVPIASYRAFDPNVPASSTGDPGTNYSSTSGSGYETNAEVALVVEWAAGLSSSGKPVKLRKWYHAVPGFAVSSPGGAQLSAANVTALTSAANTMVNVLGSYGVTLSSGSGRLAGAATVLNQYGNHQMPRGRRRKVTSGAKAQQQNSEILQILENKAYEQANS